MSSNQAPGLERIRSLPNELNERLLKRLNKSVVFADPQFMEWFNLTIGIDTLIRQAGVHTVKEFSSFENGEEHVKAVFLISQPLKGIVLDTLKEIIIASRFQFIIIITNLDPNSYDESPDLFDMLTDKCLTWMDNPNYTCEVFYERFPFVIFPQHLSTNPAENSALLFINPFPSWGFNQSDNSDQIVSIDTYQRLVKQEMTDLSSATTGTTGKDHLQQVFQNFGQNEICQLKALSSSINEMIDALEARVDCFTMGVLSTLVANEINNTRRKNSPNKVSLLLIDRNLDLPVVSLFQEETVFDKINNLLPNLCPYSNDLRVDLRNFLFENKFKSIDYGNFFHFSTDACRTLVELFLQSKPKECAIEVYRKLCEVCPMSESGKDKKASRISSDLLKIQMRSGVKNNPKNVFENIDLIQIITAYSQISDSQSTKYLEFDKLASFVKVLTPNILNKDGPSVLSRLYGLFSEKIGAVDKTDKSISYSISDLIVLLIYVYSLIGEECFYGTEEEQRIKKLLINEFQSESFQKDSKFKSDLEFFNKIKKNMNISQFVEKFFQNLKQLKHIRRNLKTYNKLLIHDESKDQYVYKPLIRQVFENIVKTMENPAEPPADIEYRMSGPNEGFNLFKSFKIGYLMNTSSNKPHPLNNDLLIIYVIGGITSYEFKLVKEALKEYQPGKNVLIGSSHFCNHSKLIKYLLN